MNATELWNEPHNSIKQFAELEKWKIISDYCDVLLIKSDHTQLPDSGLSISKRMEWQVYRENIRSIRDDFSTPDDVIFPTEPAEE